MTDGPSQGSPGCFRVGCLGCAGLLGLAAAILGILVVIQFTIDREPSPIEESLSYELPPVPAETVESLEQVLAAEEPAFLLDRERPIDLGDPPVGRIVLDLSLGEFSIRPGPPEKQIQLEADYDESSFRLREELLPSEDGGFVYTLRFGGRGGLPGLVIGGNRGSGPRIDLTLPRGRPLDITGSLGIGETEAELGGLWIRNLDLRLGTGEHTIRFSEPTLLPVERLRLRKSIGVFEVRDLGAASPLEAIIEQRIGEFKVDLDGPWRRDAHVSLRLGIGGASIRLPDEARVELDQARVSIGERRVELPDPEDAPAGAPTVRLEVRGTIGELIVD